MQQNKTASSVLDSVRRFVTSIQHGIEIHDARVFGSWAYGKPTPESDVDVAIITNRAVTFDEELDLAVKAKQFDPSIELLVFERNEYQNAHRAITDDIKQKGIPVL